MLQKQENVIKVTKLKSVGVIKVKVEIKTTAGVYFIANIFGT